MCVYGRVTYYGGTTFILGCSFRVLFVCFVLSCLLECVIVILFEMIYLCLKDNNGKVVETSLAKTSYLIK